MSKLDWATIVHGHLNDGGELAVPCEAETNDEVEMGFV